MKSGTLTCITAITLFAALATPLQLTAQHTRYTVTDLGTLGGTFSLGAGINNRGSVTGFSALPGDTAVHAFLWQKGVMTDLGTLGGPNSTAAEEPTESEKVGGYAETSTPDPFGEDFCGFPTATGLICLPFLWQKGVMTPLPTLGGNNGSAFQVNNRGQVAGFAENATPDPTCDPLITPQVLQVKPVIWRNGSVQELPTFAGDPDGIALAINDIGQAAGNSGSCKNLFFPGSPAHHLLLWQNGRATDLGNLGGTIGGNALDINNQGQVVGLSFLPGDTIFHAFLWQNGVMRDLGTLPGDFASSAWSINSKGQVAGASFDINGNERAFLWQNGVMTELNTLIPPDSPLFLIEADSINSRGQIAGWALQTSTDEIHPYMVTPSQGGTGESATLAARGETSERPKVVLPENVRKMLRQRLGSRFHIPGLGAPKE
jgi:probable HAF family extracellular repeat protein